MYRTIAILALMAMTSPLTAQWLSTPTPGVPRMPDGAPDLSAPAPRAADGHPDLTGLWRTGRIQSEIRDLENVQPWVREVYAQSQEIYFTNDPRFRCLPSGPENLTAGGNSYGLRRILQHPDMLAILYNDGTYREIFTDGRELEANPLPTWMGYSAGRWDGDTLVVESNGYNDRTWLARGIAHTDQLRITERYHRPDYGHLRIEVTYDDPGALEAPLNAVIEWGLATDEVMLETVCAEAYGDGLGSWTSRVEERDDSTFEVAPEVLAGYVGTYNGMYLGNAVTMRVSLENGALFAQRNNGAKQQLIPRSEALFDCDCGWGYRFTPGDDGVATEIAEIHVSGAWPFARVAD